MTNGSMYRSPEGERVIQARYDSILASWPAPYRALRLPTRHGETFAIESGEPDRPPLVMLHVASANSAMWGEDFARLSRVLHVFAVDLPGEPGKSAAVRLALTGPAFGEWLGDVLDGLGLERAHVLGYSQGGWTALRFATLFPERVERLVLIAPGGIAAPRASLMVKLLPFMVLGRLGQEPLKRILLGAKRLPPAVDQLMNAVLRHFKPRMEKEYLFGDEELRRLTMPVLLLTGSADAVRDSPRVVERMRRLVPKTQHHEYRGLGHLLLDFADEVLRFLAAKGPGKTSQ